MSCLQRRLAPPTIHEAVLATSRLSSRSKEPATARQALRHTERKRNQSASATRASWWEGRHAIVLGLMIGAALGLVAGAPLACFLCTRESRTGTGISS